MALLAMLLLHTGLQAQSASIFHQQGTAVHGYDVVAFFTDSNAVAGHPDYHYQWQGVNWLFASAAHRDAFAAAPERFAPQYGGFCAYGTAGGYKAPTQIETWTIVDGKLYFNYNNKVKNLWSKNIPALVSKADSNWVKIKDKE